MERESIRQANWDAQADCDAFLSLLDHYSRDPFGGGAPLPKEIRDVLVDRWRNHAGAFSLIAWRDSTPVGMANCLTSFSTFRARPRINIHDLVVHADYRGHGLGRKLIEAVCEQSRARGACQVTLEVRADNEHARRLYQRCGFQNIDNPPQPQTHFFGYREVG
jgi:ribosomal protein S18 acetylase RimI-like enzyme